uniref:Putative secreted protein n=1 Tax=Anopheles darlingi TaxID=43151 RepID=A0A2M4D3S2_ANODA
MMPCGSLGSLATALGIVISQPTTTRIMFIICDTQHSTFECMSHLRETASLLVLYHTVMGSLCFNYNIALHPPSRLVHFHHAFRQTVIRFLSYRLLA